MRWIVCLSLMLPLLLIPVSGAFAEDIHKEKSLYRNIVVREKFGRRCLVFAIKRGDRNQTCINLRNPQELVFPYTRMSLAGLLVAPAPSRILIIGLGGGSMPLTLSELFPEVLIDVVEIDEAVVRVAKKYFNYQDTATVKTIVSDGRVFVKRAGLRKHNYDLIFLDAFTGEYIPEHLMTREFLEEIQAILSPKGVLVANTFSTSRLYHHESETYRAVYGNFFNFKMPITGNRVIIATANGELPDQVSLEARASVYASRLSPYSVDVKKYPAYMRIQPDWDTSQRPLTDQYSPANLLQGDF